MDQEYFNLNAPLNEETRYDHGEGCVKAGASSPDTRGRLFVKHVPKGWYWYCHNCGSRGYRKKTPHEYLKSNGTEKPKPYTRKFNYYVPDDLMDDLPSKASGWARSYGITDQELDAAGFRYSERAGRLIMPVYRKETCMGWQGRKIADRPGPKYVTQRLRIDQPFVYERSPAKGNICVLVEDILSAIKVGRYIPTIALLGSPEKLQTELSLYLEDNFDLVVVALDPDKYKTQVKIISNLNGMFNVKATFVMWDCDPKEKGADFLSQWADKVRYETNGVINE